jgi:hypothetical protein
MDGDYEGDGLRDANLKLRRRRRNFLPQKRTVEGGSISDLYNGVVDRVKGFFKGVRLDFPPKERALLKMYGHYNIVQMTLCRAPIASALNKVLDVISLGKWSELKTQYNYDSLFHLYMIIKLSNNSIIRLEKNQVINISNNFQIEKDAEFLDVPLHGKKITLQELLDFTIRNVGLKQVFVYSAFSTNCQRFLIDVLSSNGLLTEKEQHFILQDLSELSKKLPWYTKAISQHTTDLSHRLDILTNGQGF